ncbi:multidrug efflux system outer membrane subunit [Parvularcula bermudensis HTCC2503]|uniref:Multidrug efflux system outer membrane subunit n=1 Tax=Parvularcula bermudensis (strain ATCC BAA-594 / HTCC2503 / KCTC 12087) TaxID=314260 RepID=E0TCY9_PARBH|nr:efflux transporter outer membrane subunit [Parvularcula bermudensis]ADM10372.1 multidrug efflux system outer membrane subunit [Parvularcula bermudensis HTCC2503]
MKGRICILGGALLSLTACAVGPDPTAPTVDLPATYSAALPADLAGQDEEVWWAGFEDETLSTLMVDVLAGNLDIATALATLSEAAALRGAVRSDLFPRLDAQGSAEYADLISGEGESETTTLLSGVLAFEVDLAGGNRRRLEAAAADLEAAGFGVREAQRLATGTAALQYIDLRRSGARLALLETSLDLQARTLDVVQARFDAGLTPALDVDRAAADLARTRADRGILQANRQAAAFTLAVLAGRPPERAQFGQSTDDILPDYRGEITLGAPAMLLRQRPDVAQAEQRLIADLALIGAEQADLYPSLRLPAQISGDPDTDFEPLLFTLSAIVDIPLLDAGRRRAEVRAQIARAEASLAEWQQTVLVALTEVETALTRIEALRSRLENLDLAVQRSEEAYRQLDALYREGLTSFIDVLDAQRTLIGSREAVVEARADLAVAIVQLHIGMGTGI